MRVHHLARGRRGYTLVEMLTTVAVLIIVMGLMVTLARHVRERAAVALTGDVLRRLDAAMAQYRGRHDRLPAVLAFPPPLETGGTEAAGSPPGRRGTSRLETGPAEDPGPSGGASGPSGAGATSRPVSLDAPTVTDAATRERLLEAAGANNRQFVAALRADAGLGATCWATCRRRCSTRRTCGTPGAARSFSCPPSTRGSAPPRKTVSFFSPPAPTGST